MILKNTVEDTVILLIDEMLEEKTGFYQSPIFKHDLAAFVLNRVPPKYLMSNRGLLHYEKEIVDDKQQKADIISLIIKGINLICERRNMAINYENADFTSEEQVDDYYFNFPHFFGKVLSAKTMSSISDVEVTLYFNNDEQYELAKMINSNWNNPYKIAKETNGYYAFWVKPIKAENQETSISEKFNFVIKYSHKNLYEPYYLHFSITSVSEKFKRLKIQKDYFKKFEDILLNV